MKTIQEYLKKADKEKLIEEYLLRYPIDYEREMKPAEMTVNQMKEKKKERLSSYIDHLCSLTPEEPRNNEEGMLYIYRVLKDGIDEVESGLTDIKELLEKGIDEAKDYAYEFAPQPEIMNYLVADNPLTQKHIYELMADVMYEASWFGYENEFLHEELDYLEEALDEADKAAEKTHTYDEEEFIKEFNIEIDKESPDEKELRIAANKAEWAYMMHSKRKERELILTAIRKDVPDKDKEN